ncbi:hypothetical protein P2318_17695 [Myxococcaceae bacterium GXIMD 01537]
MTRKAPLVAALVLLFGFVSMAGTKYVVDVQIDGSRAYGSIGFARNTADSVQSIGCATSFGGGSSSGQCNARNAAGHSVSCFTTNPQAIAVMQSINDSSWVYFSWDASGQCVNVQVENASTYQPKQL